jgi:hypothetical protein
LFEDNKNKISSVHGSVYIKAAKSHYADNDSTAELVVGDGGK